MIAAGDHRRWIRSYRRRRWLSLVWVWATMVAFAVVMAGAR